MMQWSNTKWQITPRKLLNVKWGYNFGQTLEWIEWAKYMFQRYKYWWLVVMSFHCSPTHSTPCLWRGLPDPIPKHLGPKPLGQPMDDPLGPKLMNDLFARFYCIGLKSNTQNMCWIMKNDPSICRTYVCKYIYTSPAKKNKHNILSPHTTVHQSIYTVLPLYLQLIYVYIYMYLSTTMIHIMYAYILPPSLRSPYEPHLPWHWQGNAKTCQHMGWWSPWKLGAIYP